MTLFGLSLTALLVVWIAGIVTSAFLAGLVIGEDDPRVFVISAAVALWPITVVTLVFVLICGFLYDQGLKVRKVLERRLRI